MRAMGVEPDSGVLVAWKRAVRRCQRSFVCMAKIHQSEEITTHKTVTADGSDRDGKGYTGGGQEGSMLVNLNCNKRRQHSE